MNFTQRYTELMKQNKIQLRGMAILAEIVEEYLQAFDKELRPESYQMITEYVL